MENKNVISRTGTEMNKPQWLSVLGSGKLDFKISDKRMKQASFRYLKAHGVPTKDARPIL